MEWRPLALALPTALALASPVCADDGHADLLGVVGDLDQGFVCPQFLPSDQARAAEIEQFARALAGIGLSYEDAVEVRRAILARHHCLPRGGGAAT